MGKHRFIDHRQPPKSAGIPMVLRGGEKVPANPVPEVETDEVVRLRKENTKQRSGLQELERKLTTADAQIAGLKQQVQNARDEVKYLQHQMQQPELEGKTPNRIEIVTVDDIQRKGDVATMRVLVDVDGTVGDAHVVVPVQQLKLLIQQKQRKQHHEQRENRAAGLPEVRQPNEEDRVPDRVDVGPETGRAPVQ